MEGLLQCIAVQDRPAIVEQVTRIEIKPGKKAIGDEMKAGEQVSSAELQVAAHRVVISWGVL